MSYDYVTINGKSFSAPEPIDVTERELVRLRFINPSQTTHPMHLHGTDMAVIAKDGQPLNEPQRLNTLNIAQGETHEVVFRADSTGTWLLTAMTSTMHRTRGEPGGLIVAITVKPKDGAASPSPVNTAPVANAPNTAPSPTMAPEMTDAPRMSGVPGMDP